MEHYEYDYEFQNSSLNGTLEDYYILDEEGNIICEELTEDERRFYATFAWWLEGIGQMTIGKKFDNYMLHFVIKFKIIS